MRVAVVSDTHGDTSGMLKGLGQLGAVDAVIHLGDYGNDIQAARSQCKTLYAVHGNTDNSRGLPEELLIRLGGHSVFLCHGHRYGVKQGLERLYYRGVELGADIVLFGHTHRAVSVKHDIILFNPGSAGRPYPGDKPSVGLLDFSGQSVKTDIIFV